MSAGKEKNKSYTDCNMIIRNTHARTWPIKDFLNQVIIGTDPGPQNHLFTSSFFFYDF